MNYSSDCFELVKASEGCRLQAYQDPVGIWTIGYGHTGSDVTPTSLWTQAQADLQLAADLQIAAEQVASLFPEIPFTQGQFDALTDLAFNIGIGRLKASKAAQKILAGDMIGAAWEIFHEDAEGGFHGFVFGGGKILPGLVARRKKEMALWDK